LSVLALTGAQGRLMLAIWKLQTKNPPAQHITTADLARVTKQPRDAVARLIGRINERRWGKQYFLVTRLPDESGGRGRARNSYQLNPQKVVTFPETAIALLELASYGPSPFRIRRSEFESFLVRKYSMDAMFLQERLDEAIKAGYVEIPASGYIWRSALIESERAYLELLKEEFKVI
jgi:hypothetical protein